MERFTERDIDLWRKWMEGETVYARSKFQDEEQQGSVAQGINRGTFSWGGSASGYLLRAIHMSDLLLENPEAFKRVSLKVSRDFGKAAHNHYACAVFSNNVLFGLEIDGQFVEVLDDVEQLLLLNPFDEVQRWAKGLDRAMYQEDRDAFSSLQSLQDRGESESFREQLLIQTARAHAGFIIGANCFGWPEPGQSSTEDPKSWDLAL